MAGETVMCSGCGSRITVPDKVRSLTLTIAGVGLVTVALLAVVMAVLFGNPGVPLPLGSRREEPKKIDPVREEFRAEFQRGLPKFPEVAEQFHAQQKKAAARKDIVFMFSGREVPIPMVGGGGVGNEYSTGTGENPGDLAPYAYIRVKLFPNFGKAMVYEYRFGHHYGWFYRTGSLMSVSSP
jgi:hypothetical protein